MSLFNKPAAEFPFRAATGGQPLNYTLKSDWSDSAATTILTVVWALIGPAIIVFVGEEVLASFGVIESASIVSWGLAALFLIGWAIYTWPVIANDFREVEITIEDDQVHVREKSLWFQKSWSDPLNVFEGVTQLNLGHHQFGDSTDYVTSIVLKHPDPAKSVPLAIDKQKAVGQKTVKRYAEALDLPTLEGVGDDTGEQAYAHGTFVENTGRGKLVTIVFWIMTLGIIGFSIAMIMEALNGEMAAALVGIPASVLALYLFDQFAARYVTQMREWQGDIYIRTAAVRMQEYRYSPEDFKSMHRFEGKSNTNQQRSPFIALFVQGKWIPFIIDLQAAFVDTKRLSSLCND